MRDGDSVYSSETLFEILWTPEKTCLICMGTPAKTCRNFWQSFYFKSDVFRASIHMYTYKYMYIYIYVYIDGAEHMRDYPCICKHIYVYLYICIDR